MISSLAVASHIRSLTKLWIQLEPKNVNSIMERRDVFGSNTEFTNEKVCVVGSSGGGDGEVGLSGGGGVKLVRVVVGYPSSMETMPMSPPRSQSSWVRATH
jgi:hypothetical protein